MVNENLLLAQNNASHAVGGGGDVLAIELADVLVTVRAEVAIAIIMQSQVEFGAMLNHRFVQRRQQHVILIVQIRNGNHQQAMILAGVAIHNRRTMISARLVCPEYFSRQRLLKVGHQSLVKS